MLLLSVARCDTSLRCSSPWRACSRTTRGTCTRAPRRTTARRRSLELSPCRRWRTLQSRCEGVDPGAPAVVYRCPPPSQRMPCVSHFVVAGSCVLPLTANSRRTNSDVVGARIASTQEKERPGGGLALNRLRRPPRTHDLTLVFVDVARCRTTVPLGTKSEKGGATSADHDR